MAVVLEGTTPLLVEVQALVSRSSSGQRRGGSRRAFDAAAARPPARRARAARPGCAFADRDVFVNLVGGVACDEPALDLAVAAALLSSAGGPAARRPTSSSSARSGLLGEVRAVSRAAERVREAAALGFGRVALPERNAGSELALPAVPIAAVGDLLALLGVRG